MTPRNKKLGLVAAGVVALLGIGGAAVAVAGDGPESEEPIRGTALQRASDAALAHTGGGEVTDTESGDEEGRYEVEVTRPDGSEVDVHLDSSFDVIGAETEAPEKE